MKSFKELRNGNVLINKIEYKVYCIGELPSRFGFYWDKEREIEGIGSWWKNNKKGLIYIVK
jgi:hypothetical protein